jgi:hypothetical protein
VINVGTILRIEQTDGQRARFAAAWWEWDCGLREGRDVTLGLTDRGERRKVEKKERRKKVIERTALQEIVEDVAMGEEAEEETQVIPETQVLPDTQVLPETQPDLDSQMTTLMEDMEY